MYDVTDSPMGCNTNDSQARNNRGYELLRKIPNFNKS